MVLVVPRYCITEVRENGVVSSDGTFHELDSLVLLKVHDGVTHTAARAEVEQVLASYPNAELQDQAEAKAAMARQ